MAKTILFFKDLVSVFAFYGLMRKYNRRQIKIHFLLIVTLLAI